MTFIKHPCVCGCDEWNHSAMANVTTGEMYPRRCEQCGREGRQCRDFIPAPSALATSLTESFAASVRNSIQEHHEAGHSVPVSRDGKIVQIEPFTKAPAITEYLDSLTKGSSVKMTSSEFRKDPAKAMGMGDLTVTDEEGKPRMFISRPKGIKMDDDDQNNSREVLDLQTKLAAAEKEIERLRSIVMAHPGCVWPDRNDCSICKAAVAAGKSRTDQ